MRVPRTIKARLLALTVLAVVAAVALGLTGFMSVRDLDASLARDQRAITAMHNQGEVDGANYAVQYDLTRLSTGEGDPAEVKDHLAEQLDSLRELPGENRTLLVRDAPELAAVFDAFEPKARAFADAAEAVQHAIDDNDPAYSELADAELEAERNFDEQLDATSEAIGKAMSRQHAASQADARRAGLLTALVTLAALVLLPFGLFVTRSIVRPLRRLRDSLADIADGDGDLTVRLDEDGRDELAAVASAFNRFVAKLQSAMHRIAGTAELLGGSSTALTAASTAMAGTAETASGQLDAASDAAEQVSASVEAVAAAMEEIGTSIRDVATNAAAAARVAGTAVTIAADADATVARLGAASAEIGEVVGVINAIAEQTNLLALNATIEAARAGEAGKGFAVVATEVKELAKETAAATNRITERIAGVQAETDAAVTAIREIGRVIGEIDASQTEIAAAVEQQTASTSEIGRRVSDASNGTESIARTMTAVAGTADGTSRGAAETAEAAGDLSRMASELGELVGQFRY